jgi:glucose/mannose transport system permease protein
MMTAARRRTPKNAHRFNSDQITAVLMVLPSWIAIFIFVYVFIFKTAGLSLLKVNDLFVMSGPKTWLGFPEAAFVGLKNYLDLLGNDRFRADIMNMLSFTMLFVGCSLTLGLFLAVLINAKVRLEDFWRNIFFFPMALSLVVTGTVWRWVFNTASTSGFGLNWITNPNMAIFTIVIAGTWQMSGYVMALYLAGLRGIPSELLEAARVDGATEPQIFWRITLPLLSPITVSAGVLLIHISLKIFDLVFVMTGNPGGPGFSTDMPALYMFQATFKQDLYSRGAAIATFMLIVAAVIIVPYLVVSNRKTVEQ